jgi:hypothetical protein
LHDFGDDAGVPRAAGRGDRIAAHLEGTVDQVEDPVVRDARPGVETALENPVPGLRRHADLHGEEGPGRMALAMSPGATRYDRQVWLGLGFLALYHALWVVYVLVLTSIWPVTRESSGEI